MTTPTLAQAIDYFKRFCAKRGGITVHAETHDAMFKVLIEGAEKADTYAGDLDAIHAACLPFGALHPDPHGALGRILAMSTRNRQIVDEENK